MQALKSLVIGMGILIAIGMVLLIYGLIQRASNPEFTFFGLKGNEVPVAPESNTAKTVRPFGDITVPLPSGCRIEGMRPTEGRLFVWIGPDGSCASIIAIDISTGKVLGNVKFWAAP
ncbi:MAG: hypothetical protein ISR47_03805 [Rhodospirillales bacterium]|nr:hypothetical protein [Rhodospirillales bacterium]